MGNWAIMAHEHWKKFLPNYYLDLLKQGILEETINTAEEQMTEAMGILVCDQGMRHNEALETLLPQYILLPPEPGRLETLQAIEEITG